MSTPIKVHVHRAEEPMLWKTARYGLLVALAFAVLIGVGLEWPPRVTPPFTPTNSSIASSSRWTTGAFGSGLAAVGTVLTEAGTPPYVRAMELVQASIQADVLYALVLHGVMDGIPKQGATAAQLGKKLGLNEDNLRRYLHAAVTLGLATESSSTFALTSTGSAFRSDAPQSLRPLVLLSHADFMTKAWRYATDRSLKTGRSGFVEAHGQELYSFLETHPQASILFNAAMVPLSEMTTAALLQTWQPPAKARGTNATLCDIGGGVGTLLAEWLKHYPDARGFVLDSPSVVDEAVAFLHAQGVGGRAKVVGGSFLEKFPVEMREQCDVYLIKHCLHNWPDASAIAILRAIKESARAGSVVGNIDMVTDSALRGKRTARLHARMDLAMLALAPAGAHQRTSSEFARLYAASGLPEPTVVNLATPYASLLITPPLRAA